MDPSIVAFCSAMAIVGLSLAAIAGLMWVVAQRVYGREFDPAVIAGAVSGLIGGVGLALLIGYWVYSGILTAITG